MSLHHQVTLQTVCKFHLFKLLFSIILDIGSPSSPNAVAPLQQLDSFTTVFSSPPSTPLAVVSDMPPYDAASSSSSSSSGGSSAESSPRGPGESSPPSMSTHYLNSTEPLDVGTERDNYTDENIALNPESGIGLITQLTSVSHPAATFIVTNMETQQTSTAMEVDAVDTVTSIKDSPEPSLVQTAPEIAIPVTETTPIQHEEEKTVNEFQIIQTRPAAEPLTSQEPILKSQSLDSAAEVASNLNSAPDLDTVMKGELAEAVTADSTASIDIQPVTDITVSVDANSSSNEEDVPKRAPVIEPTVSGSE